MPNSETFANYYFHGFSAPSGATTYSFPAGPNSTLFDTADSGVNDGMTDVGAALDWSDHTGGVTLYGFSGNGDPIVLLDDGSYYTLSNDAGLNGQLVSPDTSPATYVYCFAQGTMIAGPDREIPVQDLSIGDLVQTAEGRTVPVKWIGRQTVHNRIGAPKTSLVRIRAGALGNGLPHTDLTVTADHGMVIDGYVINASALVNGTTIDFVPRSELPETFTVYHVETEAHEVILANGAPSETFIDYRDRRSFENHDEYLGLYGCERIVPEMRAPRISSARHLPAGIRARLGIEISHSDSALRA
ncbi:Hint domain-containing protein [Mameliella sp. CS4]|uniref:Hint domain-containing protein n=1 Tax=Mameliella sp. CS4 TaxID=2862329 RepID=UPI001C5D25A2|nr:Hint domain-containing protein [Mameliella sp. CS4]MBW4982066.1 Hint domain-containing protein [Mameliella sp. CS4]